jgi:hypothetical protein
LPDLVASGQVSIPNKDYEFQSPEGEKYKVGAKGFLDAVKMGWTYRDQGIIKDEELEKKYGDSTVKALFQSGARGLTLGLSDPILKATGLADEEELAAIKKYNPTASTLGEIAGTVAPALLSGGSGLAGRALLGRQLAKGVGQEAAEQVVAKAGTGLINKLASYTPASLLESGAELVGQAVTKRAAQNIKSEIAKRALEMGAAGLVEGGVLGVGQTISEAALGDHEFNAESLLSNVGTGALLGAGTGGLVGGAIEGLNTLASKATRGADKQAKRAIVNQIENPALRDKFNEAIDNGEAQDIALAAMKDPEMMALKEQFPDLPVSRGMESAFRPVKQAENYLYDAPSAAGEEIRKTAKQVEEYTQNKVDEIWTGARQASPEETGDLIKSTFITKIQEPWSVGSTFYGELMDSPLGNAPVKQARRTELANVIKKSDAYRVGKEGSEIKRVLGVVEDQSVMLDQHLDELQQLGLNKRQAKEIINEGGISAKMNKEINNSGINIRELNNTLSRQAKDLPTTNLTLKQIQELKSDIGAAIRTSKGSEKKLLINAYEQLGGMMDSVITESVAGKKNGQKIIDGLKAANADYRRAYAAKDQVAEFLGIKGKDLETVIENLNKASAVDLADKFINLKKSDKAAAALSEFPEIGKLAIAFKQNELINKNITKNGINFGGIRTTLEKMPKEQRALYFGSDPIKEKQFMDILSYWEKRPQTLNPSGTDIRNEVRNLLSPKHILQNWVFSSVYQGDKSAAGKIINDIASRALPVLGSVEKSANKTKDRISSSVNGFLNKASAGVTVSALNQMSDKDMEKARKNYEQVQQNPEEMIENFSRKNQALFDAAPETANALQQRVVAGVQFLQSKVPHRDQEYIGEKIEPSRSELIKFGNYVEAIERPQVVFEQMKQGYVNPDSIEALRTVYPKMYASIQAEFNAKMPKSLTRAQKIQLQPLLGMKVTPAMDYNNLMILQGKTPGAAQANAQTQSEMGNQVPVTGAKNLSSSSRTQSGLDKSINRT